MKTRIPLRSIQAAHLPQCLKIKTNQPLAHVGIELAAIKINLQEPLAGRIALQVDQAALANKEIFVHQRERGKDANLVRHRHPGVDRHCQKGAATELLALHLSTVYVGLGLRENPCFMRHASR